MRNISCRRAVDLINKKEEHRITQSQRFDLWRHLALCDLCRTFFSQNNMIIASIRNRNPGNATLDDSQKGEIVSTTLQNGDGK